MQPPQVFFKKGVFKNFAKFIGKHVPESLFKTVAGLRSFFIKKGYLAEVFSCEFCEIFKNNFFHKTPTVAVSYEHARIGRFPNLHSSTFKLQNHLKVWQLPKFTQSNLKAIWTFYKWGINNKTKKSKSLV